MAYHEARQEGVYLVVGFDSVRVVKPHNILRPTTFLGFKGHRASYSPCSIGSSPALGSTDRRSCKLSRDTFDYHYP